jgi:hypothetical protein
MTPVAISTGAAILAWIGLAVGVIVLLTVVALFTRVLRPAREIDAYAKDILVAGQAIARNVEVNDELETTRTLAGALPGLAVDYLRKLGLMA